MTRVLTKFVAGQVYASYKELVGMERLTSKGG